MLARRLHGGAVYGRHPVFSFAAAAARAAACSCAAAPPNPDSEWCMLEARMARNARPTAAKREREKALLERRQQKAARRQDSKERKAGESPRDSDDDPDIAHIKLGPQPLADWQMDEEES